MHPRNAKLPLAPALSALLLAGAAALAQGPQPPASVPLPTGATAWNLIFDDGFDGTAYDTSRWNPYADWSGNNSFNAGRERYFASQIRLSNGICNLVAEPNPQASGFTGSYLSGELISARANMGATTPYKLSFLYGYVEARAKIVNVSGFFGAIWMVPSKPNFTYEWEIDILEVLGHDHLTMFQTYHYFPGLAVDSSRNRSWTPNRGTGNNGDAPVLDYSTDYHTYGVDWQPGHLTFYIDGIASGSFPSSGAPDTNIARTPGYILIQHMVENSWIRNTGHLVPDTASSVDTFHIDYVRVWQGVSGNAVRRAGRSAPGLAPAARSGQERVVCDGRGRVVRRLPADQPLWDGLDQQGHRVSPGVYRCSVGGMPQTGTIVRMR